MKDNQPSSQSHPAETLIAAYAIGRCSPAEQAEIDEHCFTCEKCRTRLSILLRVCAADGSEEERRQLERLFPLGIETIAQARQDGGQFTSPGFTKDRQVFSHQAFSPQPDQQRFLDLLIGFIYPKRYQLAAALLVIIAIAGGSYYWYARTHSTLQNTMAALNSSYKFSRPLEARVTGGFTYQPYQRKRGNADDADVNRDQINYALAELTRTVASHPTPETRHALGRLYLLLGKFDDAEQQMKSALEDSPRNAGIHTDLAALYYERSKYAEPLPLLSLAVQHYKDAIEIDPELAEAWFNRALCYEQMKAFNQASADWERYLQIDAKSSWATEAREHLKKLKARADKSLDTSKNTKLALEKAAKTNDEAGLRQLVSQNFVAVKQFSTGSLFDNYLNEAVSSNEQSAEVHLKTIRLIGRLTSEIKKDEYLNDLASFASRASPETKVRMQSIRLMLRQADDEFNRSSHDAAFKLYQSAYYAAERIGDQEHAETAALSLFRYYNLRAKTQELATLGSQIVAQSEHRHHRQVQAKAHIALANAYLTSQQSALALENSLRALDIAKELGDTSTTINSLRFASAAYSRTGDYSQALNKDFELLSSLQDEPVSPLTVVAYQQAGETLFRLGNYQIAYSYQQESLQIATSINNPLFLAGSAGRLALTLWKLGRGNEATSYLNDAISRAKLIPDQTSRRLLQVELYTTLGDVSLDQGNADESIASYQLAIQALKASNNRVYLSAMHQGLAAAYLAQGKIPKAEAEFRISILLAERDRQQIKDASSRSAFLASRQNVYRSMVDLQFNGKQAPAAAFDYAEIAKSRDLLDTLSGKTITNWKDGRATVSISGSAQPLTLKQIQHALPRNEQLLSYSIAEKRVMIWLLTSDAIYTASVDFNADQLQQAVSRYLADIRSRRNIDVINRQSADLYQLLIAPIAHKLDSNRLLCIIPDRALYQLPFAALFSSGNKHYLIEDFSITTAPSASILIKTTRLATIKNRDASESFIGVSNPRFNNQRFPGLPTLPSAEEEVTRARSLYTKSEHFKQEEATESEMVRRMGNHEIVHIASHILIDEQSPLLSSILLAEENVQGAKEKEPAGIVADGTLKAQEIYQLVFPRTRLVILSGCRSAAGNFARGEALGTLAQSFFAAKIPAVIASLWEVDDESTAEIMYSLHYNHRVKHQGFGEALNQAQRSLIYSVNTRLRHPYYWAAFLLSGNGLANDAASLN
ncbi:MAG: CHAT domain-containing protein [Acidobacteriota bacterium]